MRCSGVGLRAPDELARYIDDTLQNEIEAGTQLRQLGRNLGMDHGVLSFRLRR
jgi:hypothetical protein